MNELLSYLGMILPGLCLAGVALALLPKALTALRLAILIISFVLLRDALIPAGLWQITSSLDIRFVPVPWVLWTLALASAALALSIRYILHAPRPVLLRTKSGKAVLAGFFGSILVFFPVFIINRAGLISNYLPKPSGMLLISSLLAICLFGNFFEEILFRGYLQDFVARKGFGKYRAAIFSAVTFSLCHVFLAFSVTKAGFPVLIFTLYEGLICAFLSIQFGLLTAALAHGFGIFWIVTAVFV